MNSNTNRAYSAEDLEARVAARAAAMTDAEYDANRAAEREREAKRRETLEASIAELAVAVALCDQSK